MTDKEYLELDFADPQRLEYNKVLIKKYPWLRRRNVWTGKPIEDYDFTWLDDMPEAWRKAFGMQMIEEIDSLLKQYNYVDDYQITQIKEKYGTLRWYDFGGPEGLFDIIVKYEKLSKNICIYCGKPSKYCTTGWVEYICEECAHKNKYNINNLVPLEGE